jgi:signal transduction histidine kinase/ActR/RegA family two-component response regulator
MELTDSVEMSFDHATRLATRLLNVPIALISTSQSVCDLFLLRDGSEFRDIGDGHPDAMIAHSLSRCVIESAQSLAIGDSRTAVPPCVEEPAEGHDVVAFLGIPLRGEDGVVLGAFGAIDRVARTWTEQNVRDLEDLGVWVVRELMGRRGVEVVRLAQAQALKEIARQRDEYLSILGHELRGPLAAILGAIHLARQAGVEAEEIAWAHGVVERQSRRVVRLLDDLLDVSRLARGKVQLHKEPTPLAEIVARAVAGVREFSDRKNQELDVLLGEGPLMLHVDPARIEQVLANLLRNAVKHTEDNGRIAIHAERAEGEVEIMVSDTGVGICAEVLPHVFNLFSRMPGLPASSWRGLGIGLALVKMLTEMHGGSVEAASDGPGKGSRFSVRIPLREDSPSPTTEAEPPAPGGGPRLRVLVVDDNVDNAAGMATLLEVSGHEVRLAYDGEVAIEVALDQCPDVVLLDIGLPSRDGYAVAETLRRDERCRDAFIVALSGYGRDEDKRRSRDAGFDAHLVKPVDIDELLNLLARPRPAEAAAGTA